MRYQIAFLCLALLGFTLSACESQSSPFPTLQPTATPEFTPTSKPDTAPSTHPPTSPAPPTSTAQVQQATPTNEAPQSKNTQYKLTARLDYARHYLTVEEQISYTNSSGESIHDLLLLIEPARYPEVFKLVDLSWGDGKPVIEYTRALGQLSIPLAEALQPGNTIELSIDYELNLPSPDPSFYGRPVPFGYSSRQTNLVDWYPFMPPYIPGQGWLAHNAGPFGEHLVYELADFEVAIHLEEPSSNLIIAASTIAEVEGDWHHYDFKRARNFAWSVSHQYMVSTSTADSATIMSYYFPVNAEAGEAVLGTTSEALELYNDIFSPYPRQVLSVVEADFLDGMEYDGLYFLSKGFYNLYNGTPADYLTAIAAHETAHQWWYGSLGNDQALEPWLDEALCTYSERLYYENIHPQGLDWWWTYRINYYEPQGWVDGSIYNPAGYRAYRDAVYLNGARFLENLRQLTGDEAFHKFMRGYARKYSGQIVTADDFFASLEADTQEDITPLLEEYFENR